MKDILYNCGFIVHAKLEDNEFFDYENLLDKLQAAIEQDPRLEVLVNDINGMRHRKMGALWKTM